MRSIDRLIAQLESLPSHWIYFAMLVVTIIIVFDSFDLIARKRQQQAGVGRKTKTLGIDGSVANPGREYISPIQGLSGRPDAVIIEDGYFIPVERKPFAKKMHDRYIAQLLVYMRLIEEFEGKKPPYGYLVMGQKAKRVKVRNSAESQKWLDDIISAMRVSIRTKSAEAAPHEAKCRKCHVREWCKVRL